MTNIDLISSIAPEQALYGALSARMLADSIHLAVSIGRSDADLERRASDLSYVVHYVITPVLGQLQGDERAKAIKHVAVAIVFLDRIDVMQTEQLCA